MILTSGPWTRTSEVRYSHVRAPNDPLPPSPSSELPFRVNTVRALNIAGFQPKNGTEYGDMRDGRCWYLTCFRKIHSDVKASSHSSNVQLELFTTKGGVQRLHSWAGCDAECIDTMTPPVQAKRERNNNPLPPHIYVYRKGGGYKPRVVPLSP